MKNLRKTPLVLTLGTTLLSGMASTTAYAETSIPFAMTELKSGYMQLAEAETAPATEAKMPEGKCGDKKMEGEMKAAEGKCGDKKMPEVTKSADKPMDSSMKAAEGKCGDKKAAAAMKSGEGKCGGKNEKTRRKSEKIICNLHK